MIVKESFRDIFLKILGIIGLIFIVILLGGLIFLSIWIWIKYGNTPVSELPSWVAWLMFK